MIFLSRRESTTAPKHTIVTEIDALRAVVKARDSKAGALRAIAGECPGIGLGALENFGNGRADLSVEQLNALVGVLFPHSEYAAESGMLRSLNRTVTPLCTAHPPPVQTNYDPKAVANEHQNRAGPRQRGRA